MNKIAKNFIKWIIWRGDKDLLPKLMTLLFFTGILIICVGAIFSLIYIFIGTVVFLSSIYILHISKVVLDEEERTTEIEEHCYRLIQEQINEGWVKTEEISHYFEDINFITRYEYNQFNNDMLNREVLRQKKEQQNKLSESKKKLKSAIMENTQ